MAEPYFPPALTQQRAFMNAYPETEEGWFDRYDSLLRAYEHGGYSESEVKAYHLFRAVDDAGDEIDMTRRVYQAYRFIVDVDTRGFLGSGLTLEERAGAGRSSLPMAETIWRRAQFSEHLGRQIRSLATMGDYWYEVQLTEAGKARIVAYDPRCVTAYYDAVDGRTLEKVVFHINQLDEPRTRGIGLQPDDRITTWKRTVTPTTITEEMNGRVTRSRTHTLGVVPAVQLRWCPWTAPEHSLPAPHGVEQAVVRIDSFLTQVSAIANRHAHPTLALLGARVAAGANVQLGRVISGLPEGGDAKYLEMGGNGIGAIREVVGDIMAHVRETAPEFLFADSAAGESGEARSYRAAAFAMKIEEVRGSNLPALARLFGMAVAREEGRPYDPEADRLMLQAPPVIAPHVPSELASVKTMLDMGILKRSDAVRHAQRLGLIDRSADPEAYAVEAGDERAARAQAFMTEPEPAAQPDADGDGE